MNFETWPSTGPNCGIYMAEHLSVILSQFPTIEQKVEMNVRIVPLSVSIDKTN